MACPDACRCIASPGPAVDRDGGLDAEIVIHELTHGLSNRLVGNATGLFWNVAGGLGEGWSDFYALSLLNGSQTDDPDATYTSAAYATYRPRRPHRQLHLWHPPLSVLHGQHRQPTHLGRCGRRDGELRGRHADQSAGIRAGRRVRGAQRRRDLGADAVGSPQPGHRGSGRRERQRARRQPDDAAAGDRRAQADAERSQLHRRARGAPRCRLRDECVRERALDLGGLRRSRAGPWRGCAARGRGFQRFRWAYEHRGFVGDARARRLGHHHRRHDRQRQRRHRSRRTRSPRPCSSGTRGAGPRSAFPAPR